VKTLVVNVRVRRGEAGTWKRLTLANLAESRREPGVLTFDLFEDLADPEHFVLIESYRDELAMDRHKETAHYLQWKAAAEPLQSEPRTRIILKKIEPGDAG